MAKLSNSIAEFLNTLLEDGDGTLEIQRALIADRFNCAPSQINYVLTTRFTPYKGYYVESRRGGGGYIRIVRVAMADDEAVLDAYIDEIGAEITKDKADDVLRELYKRELITKRDLEIIRVSISDRALTQAGDERNKVRADILKNVMLVIFT
ncbi:CtsR family transcriptional regulator [Peptoniphilus equinus]|uniref:Transcriptional regulator CtsR n=1 Tax=Peptoniphilus equinus TaxID=3016343 RepID=A0ABY7QRR2_9FIRM|nr:CtsR family transcriptional regulator [Peptoniphilus equinus]WBW49475.1 CtsR family transcriptional regulator [Peptoniphilus equinus]